jgi:hypothetical protein
MSPKMCSSMMLTSPKSSDSEFWSGVAVSSNLSNGDKAASYGVWSATDGLKTRRRTGLFFKNCEQGR